MRPGRHFQGSGISRTTKKFGAISVLVPHCAQRLWSCLCRRRISCNRIRLSWCGGGARGTTGYSQWLLCLLSHSASPASRYIHCKSNGGRPGLLLYYVDSTWLTEPTHYIMNDAWRRIVYCVTHTVYVKNAHKRLTSVNMLEHNEHVVLWFAKIDRPISNCRHTLNNALHMHHHNSPLW